MDVSLNIGLKEWKTVCHALAEGRQMLLLRKGGIYESAGEFEVEHRRFVLFPTWVHQKLEQLKPGEYDGFEARSTEPSQVKLAVAAEVTDIIQLASRRQMDAIDDQHIWAPPLIDMRFNYRPENPLYLLLVRAYRLPRPVTIDNTPAYAGCKSWVPLERSVDTSGAVAAVDDEQYEARRRLIRDRLDHA